MPYEQKDNQGTIWMTVKERDGVNGRYQYYSGDCRINGLDYWINAYPKTVQTSKGQQNVLNVTFKHKQIKQEQKTVQTELPSIEINEPKIEEIPF